MSGVADNEAGIRADLKLRTPAEDVVNLGRRVGVGRVESPGTLDEETNRELV